VFFLVAGMSCTENAQEEQGEEDMTIDEASSLAWFLFDNSHQKKHNKLVPVFWAKGMKGEVSDEARE
jgi:hypothetical protein